MTTAIEERLAHLIRTVDDLSDVVARQYREIATLTRRVELLLQREAEREVSGSDPSGAVPIDRPPHY